MPTTTPIIVIQRSKRGVERRYHVYGRRVATVRATPAGGVCEQDLTSETGSKAAILRKAAKQQAA